MIKGAFIRITAFRLALLITISVGVFYFFFHDSFSLLRNFELKTLDLRFNIRGPRTPGDEVVIVAIDDYSIENLGMWPWPRSYHAELLDRLTRDGARAVGFDLILSDPEENSELFMMRKLRQIYGSLSVSDGTPEGREFALMLDSAIESANGDLIFARSIRDNANVVFSLVFRSFLEIEGSPVADENQKVDVPPALPAEIKEPEFAGDMPPPELLDDTGFSEEMPPLELLDEMPVGGLEDLLPQKIKEMAVGEVEEYAPGERFMVPVAGDVILPFSEFYEAAKRLGFVNLFLDKDGIVRWDNMVVDYGGRYYPSFVLQLLKEHYGPGGPGVEIIPGRGLSVGGRLIPLDEYGRFLINHYGPTGSFRYYSYSDVLEGVIPTGAFKDRIVLVGSAATGLGDMWPTPFSQALPGVEKHATVFSNIIHDDFLFRNRNIFMLDLAFILVAGAVLGLLLSRSGPVRAVVFTVTALAVLLFINYAFFRFMNIWVNLVYPVTVLLLVSAGVVVFKLLTEEKEKRYVKKAFKQYLSPALVEEIVRNPESLRLGGEEKELTVLFSDIRGFTSLSEGMEPEKLVSLVNTYLSLMGGIIKENSGLVDKFIGDAIMALYGVPTGIRAHPELACRTALMMIRALEGVADKWRGKGFPEIRIGVGINTGRMIAGNMGSDDRFDYTVIGDSVNLASRIEGLNKVYGTSIIISEFTAGRLAGFILRELDLVRVVGKERPIRIFELLGFEGEGGRAALQLKKYDEALALYRGRKWTEALDAFGRLSGDGPSVLYSLYESRCRSFLDAPPPEDWDGVFTFRDK